MFSKKPQALEPLIDMIIDALTEEEASIALEPPKTIEAFSIWYLEAIKILELSISADRAAPATTNRDVRMMCRCASTAAKLEEAIELSISFGEMIYPRLGKQSLSIQGNKAIFSLDSLREKETSVSHLVDITGIYAYYQLFQWLIGTPLKLNCINIGLQQRDDVLPFLRLFNAPVLVGSKDYILEFPTAYLNQSVVRTADELPEFLKTFPCEIFNSQENELARQVEALITASIKQSLSPPTLAEITDTLNIPESTLRKHLKNANTSYRQIKKACLMEVATSYLERPSMSITEISLQLGFSDDTSFRRAFKKAFTISPSQWRNGLGMDDGLQRRTPT